MHFQVNVVVNMGKDLTRDSVEFSVRTSPAAFVGLQVLDYDLYWQGGNTFLLEKDVCIIIYLLYLQL